jgi:hypothetical protein
MSLSDLDKVCAKHMDWSGLSRMSFVPFDSKLMLAGFKLAQEDAIRIGHLAREEHHVCRGLSVENDSGQRSLASGAAPVSSLGSHLKLRNDFGAAGYFEGKRIGGKNTARRNQHDEKVPDHSNWIFAITSCGRD